MGNPISRAAGRPLGAVLALTVVLSGGLSAQPQQAPPEEGFFVIVLLKAQARIDRTASDLEKIDKQLQENDAAIKDADRRLSIARETNNPQAELEPENDLQTARSARGKLKKAKSRLEEERAAAAGLYAVAKQRLTGPRPGTEAAPLGVASSRSGGTTILKKDGKKLALKRGQAGLLEAGDEVFAGNNDGDIVELLDGRATTRLGAKTRLKAEEEPSRGQAWGLVKGKAYFAVDGPGDLESLLGKGPEVPGEALGVILAKYKALDRAGIERLSGRDLKLRIAGAVYTVQGKQFAVEVMNEGAAEVRAFDGAFEISDAEGARRVLIEQDSMTAVTRNGIAEPKKAGSFDRWWEK